MRFNNCTCVCCNKAFTEADDVVVCPLCGSPHHRECWTENGKCANTSLHAEGFSWEFPEELKPRIEKKASVPEAAGTSFTFKNGENAVVCPHCNALNYGNDAFCMKCRKPLYASSERPADNGNAQGSTPPPPGFNGNNNPSDSAFEYFQQFGGVRPDIMIDGIPVIEYADYIGEKKSGRYIRRFLSMDRFGRKFSVSLSALIFGPIWYFYRKMFKEGLLFLLAILVISGLQTWCSVTETSKAVYREMGTMYSDVLNGKISLEEMDQYILELQEQLLAEGTSDEDKMKQNILTVVDLVYVAVSLAMSFLADYIYMKKL